MTTRLTPEPEGERRGRSRRFTETDLPALLLFAVLSLEVTTWFSGQKPLGWGDSGLGAFFYMPGTLLHVYNGAWNPMSGVGEPSGQLVTMLPAALFFAVMQSLHVSAWVAQAIFYWLIQVGASWWAYLFAKELLGEIGGISVPAVAASLFLNFSTLVMVSYWYLGAPNVEMVAFIPLVALLAVRAGRGQYTILGFALRGLLVADVFSCCFWNPAYGVSVVLVGLAVYCAAALSVRGSMLRAGRRLAVAAVLWVPGTAWFAVPLLGAVSTAYASASVQEPPLQTLRAAALNNDLASILTFQALRVGTPAWAYFEPAWRFLYISPEFTLIADLTLAILVLGLIGRCHRFRRIFLGVGWCAGVLLCLGTRGPTGDAYLWAFNHVPYFHAFRNPMNKFVPVLLVSTMGLYAFGIGDVLAFVRRRVRHSWSALALLPIVALTVVVYSWPMWTGAVVNNSVVIHGSSEPETSTIQVPESYTLVRRFLQLQHGYFRVLSLPLSNTAYITLRWRYGYDGVNYDWLLYGEPTIDSTESEDPEVSAVLNAALQESGLRGLLLLAGEMSVRYVVLQRDVLFVGPGWTERARYSTAQEVQALEKIQAARAFTAGSLIVYRLPTAMVVPMVSVVSTGGGTKAAGSYSFRQSGAESWQVTLPEGRRSRLVVLSAGYAQGWTASETACARGIPGLQGTHLLVDGFANGWIVGATQCRGQVDVSIHFAPSEDYQRALLIAIVWTLLLLAWAVAFGRWRNKKGRYVIGRCTATAASSSNGVVDGHRVAAIQEGA
jgi:hypothetical protein